MNQKWKSEKFSHSKLNMYKSCGWKYYLTYKQKHFTFTDSLASELGTLIHYTEEYMFNELKAGRAIDYDKVKEMFNTVNIPKKDKFDPNGGVYNINILKAKYVDEYFEPNKDGQSYHTKVENYLNTGIHRLETYLNENPDIEPYDAEKYFSIGYRDYTFSGYIDRIFHNKKTDEYIIEDIKTKGKPFTEEEMDAPLQLGIYTLAVHESLNVPYEKIKCAYDLPILSTKQYVPDGYMERWQPLLNDLLDGIEEENWAPSTSALCYYCPFCHNNPTAPKDVNTLCPYFSLWKPDDKTTKVKNKWKGMKDHEQIMKTFLDELNNEVQVASEFDFDF